MGRIAGIRTVLGLVGLDGMGFEERDTFRGLQLSLLFHIFQQSEGNKPTW